MDSFASDRKLSELGELDLQDLLDQSELFDDDDEHRPLTSGRRRRHDTDTADCDDYMAAGFKVTGSELVEHAWLDNFLDAQTTTTTITSGTRPTPRTTNTDDEYASVLPSVESQQLHHHQQQQPQCVKSEHSYSLGNNNGADFNVKIEPEEHDMDGDLLGFINPSLTLFSADEEAVTSCDVTSEMTLGDDVVDVTLLSDDELRIKAEPVDIYDTVTDYSIAAMTAAQSGVYGVSDMPPTPPPSSSCSSDSEGGGLSPERSAPPSPSSSPYFTRTHLSFHAPSHHSSLWTSSHSSALFTSPIPSSGILILSEEEKRTLVAEGYPIPTKLPLTKQEEKNLKKIRRKIKNKISAQESRRKKKEYVEHLEKRVEFVSMENITLRKKLDALESNNRSLSSQLQKLQSLASKVTATCITVK